MPPGIIDVIELLLNRLFDQAGQSNSKRGSPSALLNLSDIFLCRGSIMLRILDGFKP